MPTYNKIANKEWVPTYISQPDDNRLVIVQIDKLPYPTVGSYWADRGEWVFEERDYDELWDFEVLAWRNMPTPYVASEARETFRTAEEARSLTYLSQFLKKSNSYDRQFFDIRLKVLAATTRGQFETIIEKPSEKNRLALYDAGYTLEKISDEEWRVRWN